MYAIKDYVESCLANNQEYTSEDIKKIASGNEGTRISSNNCVKRQKILDEEKITELTDNIVQKCLGLSELHGNRLKRDIEENKEKWNHVPMFFLEYIDVLLPDTSLIDEAEDSQWDKKNKYAKNSINHIIKFVNKMHDKNNHDIYNDPAFEKIINTDKS